MTSYSRSVGDASFVDPYVDVYSDTYGPASVDAATGRRTLQRAVSDSAAVTRDDTAYVKTTPGALVGVTDLARASDAVTGVHGNRVSAPVADAAPVSDSAAATVTFREPPGGVHLKVWDKSGVDLLGIVPEFDNLNVQIEHNGVGGLSLSAPADGPGMGVFVGLKAAIVSAYEGDREIATADFTQDDDDPADEAGPSRLLSVTGPGTLNLLADVALYPDGGFNHEPTVTFGNAAGGVTPGYLLRTLLDAGRSRGCLDSHTRPWVFRTFDDDVDSAGQPWPQLLWLRYDAGQSLLDVTLNLVERGFIDTRMRRFAWDVYVQDTVLAADHPDVRLTRAREVTSAPRQADRSEVKTALLMIGEGKVSTEVVDAPSVADYGRREGNSGQSGVAVSSVLTSIGQTQLATLRRVKEGFTATYDRTAGGPQPFTDYLAGEFVRADWYRDPNTGANLPVRVRGITATYDADSMRAAEVELNDLYLEADVLLKRRIDALTNGSSAVATAPPINVTADKAGPLAPADCFVTPGVDVGPDGRARAHALISWPAVVSNDDGTVFDDDGGYHVSWQVNGTGWTGAVVTAPGATTAFVPGLPPGATFQARVQASDYNGHRSDFTYSSAVALDLDTQPPPAPSAPVVEPTLGGLRITFDGLPAGSPVVQWPADYSHVEAFVSDVAVFAGATRVAGELTGHGTITAVGLDYNVPQHVWLVAYDDAGNPSAPSAEGNVVSPTQVLPPDLGGGAVGPNALAYRDFGNKVPDGSFELQATRDRLAQAAAWASGVWSFVTGGASDGGWFLRGDASVAPATVRDLPLVTAVEAVAGDKVWFTFKAKGTAASGSAQLVLRARDSAGSVIAEQVLSVTTSSGAWLAPDVGQTFTYTFPANIATYDVLARLPAAAQAGTWGFDAVNMRQVVQTAVIDQAAVGTAQIADLAVTKEKAKEIEVSKLLAGQLLAAYIALHNGMLTTADSGIRSGQRLEFDATGLRAYDSTSTSATTGKTVEIKADGSATLSGTIGAGGLTGGTLTGTTVQTGTSGPRVILAPSPPDSESHIGIRIVGEKPGQVDSGINYDPRITDYTYITQGTPDTNTALRITGGAQNLPPGDLTEFTENAIFVLPRDQTDENHETEAAPGTGVGGCTQGIVFTVASGTFAGGFVNYGLNLKCHRTPSAVDNLALGTPELDIGLTFGEANDLRATNFAANTLLKFTGLDVVATGFLYSSDGTVHTSEMRFKENVEEVDLDGAFPLEGMRPVRFDWRDGADGPRFGRESSLGRRRSTGFLHEDLARTHPHVTATVDVPSADQGVDRRSGWLDTEMTAELVAAGLWLRRRLGEVLDDNDALRGRVGELEAAVRALGSRP